MSGFKSSKLYKAYWRMQWIQEPKFFFQEKQIFLQEAKSYYSSGGDKGTLKDYRKALKKHRVTINEYVNGYEYWKLSENERDKFISKSEMHCIYRKMIHGRVRNVFHKKDLFLQSFKHFVNREWCLAKDISFGEFVDFVKRHECILKPLDGTCGEGISKLAYSEGQDLQSVYENCKKNNYLIEECVSSCSEIADFHPQSLNTIRVVTISKGNECIVFGALLRMGAHGSVVDNTHAGGVFAPINVESGMIEVPAVDSNNNKYASHPDTGKMIVGFKIPYWDDIVAKCKEATKVVPDTIFAGWDVCVLPNGKVEIIEGNHAPDFDGGLQTPLKIGVKEKLCNSVKSLYGFNPKKLIPLFSKNYNNYDFFSY